MSSRPPSSSTSTGSSARWSPTAAPTRPRPAASSASSSAPSSTSSRRAATKSPAPTCWSRLFSERESYAVYFLQQQDMSRLDAVTYISHGVGKGETPKAAARAGGGSAETKAEKQGADKKESALKQFTVDLNEKAKNGKVDPLIGRDGRGRPDGADPLPPVQEQPALCGRSGRRQDRHRRRARAQDHRGRRARGAASPRSSTRSTWARCWRAPATAATSRSG